MIDVRLETILTAEAMSRFGTRWKEQTGLRVLDEGEPGTGRKWIMHQGCNAVTVLFPALQRIRDA
jgi:hypothetical protein